MIPLLQIPSILFKYRKWIAYGIAALLLITLVLGWRHNLITAAHRDGVIEGSAKVQAQWDKAVEAANRETARRDSEYQALQGERDKVALEVQALLNRPLPAPRLLIREVPTDAPVSSCPRLGPDFLRLYNAAADAADH